MDARDGHYVVLQLDWAACTFGAVWVQFREPADGYSTRLEVVRRVNHSAARCIARTQGRTWQSPTSYFRVVRRGKRQGSKIQPVNQWTHFSVTAETKRLWRDTFDNTPINLVTPEMIAELPQLIDQMEDATQLRVVVFESA